MSLQVPSQVLCPPCAVDGYVSQGESVPYITQLVTPLASPVHLLSLCDDGALRMFDKNRLVTPMQTIRDGHTKDLTALDTISSNPSAWIGTSRNGSMCVWDARSGPTPIGQLQGPSGAPYLSLATSHFAVAAGTELQGSDAYVDLWDLRQMNAPVHTYVEAHSDDVTSLVFHDDQTAHAHVLLSGGMDGLVCAIDTSIAKEEDAVISVGNTNASLARIGWAAKPTSYAFTPSEPLTDVGMDEKDTALSNDPRRIHLGPVYAVSNMQTVSLWDADKVRTYMFSLQMDCLRSELDARAPTSFRPAWVTDYVIDASATAPCSVLSTSSTGLFVYGGDQEYVSQTLTPLQRWYSPNEPRNPCIVIPRYSAVDIAC
ncbi:hypothetical protein ACI68E_001157 [Malassezia pachydermatis]